ncbi:MAG: sugar nucleotide-binding protein [Anaerolineales bacterium]|nr:sugar nucleotide-binding protein [Anaerolineales bacterium]
MSRLLITGASGYLGGHLLALAAAERWAVTGTYFSNPIAANGGAGLSLDLTDAGAVAAAVAAARPGAIIHTACSNRNPANVHAIVPAARHLAAAARAQGARLVHLSTDQVFDGEQAPYDDDDAPNPITEYGRAKAEAEAAVRAACPDAVIVRPSLIWSLDPLDKQTGWLVDGLCQGTRVTLFTDEQRCPVHLDDLAALLLQLARRPELAGPLNAGGAQALNRWDFGLRLLAALRLVRKPNVRPGRVAEGRLVRPRNLILRSRRAKALQLTALRGVDDVLAADLRRLA